MTCPYLANPALRVLAPRRVNTLAQFIADEDDSKALEPTLPSPHDAKTHESSCFSLAAPWGWWSPAYIVDYVTIVILAGFWHVVSDLPPYERKIDPADPDIQGPKNPVIVSGDMLTVVAVFVPLAAAVLFLSFVAVLLIIRQKLSAASVASACGPSTGHRRIIPTSTIISFVVRDFHVFAFGLVFAVGAATILTDSSKSWAGRLRPDFLKRCGYDSTSGECTNARATAEGRRSFPSGHATQSFAGLGYLALYIARLWARAFDVDRGTDYFFLGPRARFWRFMLPLLPVLLAAFVAISRIQQNAHHPTDVLAGTIIGSIFAVISHECFFNARQPNMHGH